MQLKIIDGDKPSFELSEKDMPHYDENFVYIPLWLIYELAEKHKVSKKSVFWQVLNHEILHIQLRHRPYNGQIPRCGRDFQMWANSYRKTQMAAMPESIDEEIRILNDAMKQSIESDIKNYHAIFKKSMLSSNQ